MLQLVGVVGVPSPRESVSRVVPDCPLDTTNRVEVVVNTSGAGLSGEWSCQFIFTPQRNRIIVFC